MTLKTYAFKWCGICISLKHVHKYCGVIEHVEIRAVDPENAPLPITETGYKSHFVDEASISDYGNPQAYVLAWLDEASSKPEWQRQRDAASQYFLF